MRSAFDTAVVLLILVALVSFIFQQQRLIEDMKVQSRAMQGIVKIETFRICRAIVLYDDIERPEFCEAA